MRQGTLSLLLPAVAGIFLLLSSCRSSSPTAAQPGQADRPLYTDRLLAYFPFSGNADDHSGHHYDGIIHGAALAPDRFGALQQAYSFNGSDASIDIMDSDSMAFSQNLTLCAWIHESQGGNYPGIISKGNVGTYHESFALYLSQYNRLGFLLNQDGTQSGRYLLESDTAMPLSTWIHVACTYDGYFMTLYVNGRKAAQYMFPGTIFSTPDDILIGESYRDSSTTPPTYFNGSIDEVLMYNRTLSADEIHDIYTNSASNN